MDRAQLARIAERYRIELILQFGSTVTGRTHERSDVDIAVLSIDRDLPLARQIDLTGELQDLSPDREVDLSVLDHADPLFLKKVLDSAVLLHGSARRLCELKMYAFRRYQDHKPYLRMEREFVRRTVEAARR